MDEDTLPTGYTGSKYSLNRNNAMNKRQFSIASSTNTMNGKMEESVKTVPKQPFSIKKATSVKKQPHQIDYKATYYAAKDQLQPIENINGAIKELIKNLPNDNDWNKQFDALNLVRRFIKNHDDEFGVLYENLPTIMPEVLKLVESLRSSLSKNAMITLS